MARAELTVSSLAVAPPAGRQRERSVVCPASLARTGRRSAEVDRRGGPAPALAGKRFLRAHNAELVSLWVGKDSPGLGARLADVRAARPQRKEAFYLPVAVRGGAGQIEVHAVLDNLRTGHRHEANTDGCVRVRPDDDLVGVLRQDPPAKRLRPEPGQPGQVMSVDHDVVKSDRHADSLPPTPGESLRPQPREHR